MGKFAKIYNAQKNYREERHKKAHHDMNQIDLDNVVFMKHLEELNPNLAKHVVLKNKLLMTFASRVGGGINLLEQPMCKHCEAPASWDMPDAKGNQKAYCFGCGTYTTSPMTVKDYMLEHLKGFDEEQLNIMLQDMNSLDKDQDIIT